MASTTFTALPSDWMAADMWTHLGGIPLERIRMVPPPGTATEQDVLEAESRSGRACELIDGVLVEKTVGYFESLIAAKIIQMLGLFVEERNLGIVLGEAATLRILPNQVRIPDVCFIAWARFPERRLPRDPIPAVAPDLAIEVLSPGNTAPEMQRKLHDYFTAGVRMVWYIDPAARCAKSYTAETQGSDVAEDQTFCGGDVLPDFQLSLAELFARAGQRAE